MSSVRQRRAIRPLTVAIIALLIAIIGIVAVSVWSMRSPTPQASSADATNPQLVALGRQVYAAQCANCHGAKLEGQPNWQQPLASGFMPAPPHDETGHTWHHSDQSLFTTVKLGGQTTAPAGYRSAMPGFTGILSDTQIWAVLAYIKSTWSPEIQALQQQGHE